MFLSPAVWKTVITVSLGVAFLFLALLLLLYLFETFLLTEVDTSMIGRTVIVTGSNCGIGKETAIALARKGAHIILACRSMERGSAAAIDIKRLTGNKDIEARHLDLANFESITQFANSVDQCHTLVNNAGAILEEFSKTNGIETTMIANHLGPFLLTNLLLPVMNKTISTADHDDDGRIIFVGSTLEKRSVVNEDISAPLDWMVEGPQPYDKWASYSNSKLCTLLTVRELHR
jgi:NAD(P)-dependent dehydrogenase (short-subunit alcohol dehydrogenase family)